ncbi:histidine phosphatase family protein [Streptomyces sp. NPDC014894]|uniref:histidine phosphatase family protein n=1 Tax=Streptomyces sp. NPDC014894 TaxID=3364931 RepID=UPI0036FC56FD
MTLRLMLVAPVTTAALRGARFPVDEPPDAAGLRAARAAAGALPRVDRAVCAPAERCRGTALALGLRVTGEDAPADWDMGRWRGRSLAEVSAAEPDAVARWLADPSAAPHGGESLTALRTRVGAWLDGLPAAPGRLLAVVDPAVVRAALVHALALPPQTFWRLDIAPLALTELTTRTPPHWNLHCGARLQAPGDAPPGQDG